MVIFEEETIIHNYLIVIYILRVFSGSDRADCQREAEGVGRVGGMVKLRAFCRLNDVTMSFTRAVGAAQLVLSVIDNTTTYQTPRLRRASTPTALCAR